MGVSKNSIKYPNKTCADCGLPTTGQGPRCRSCGVRFGKLGSKNPMWKGDKVGYYPLHRWVVARLKKPKLCNECKNAPPRDLANKGIYDRNLDNWEWLCRLCHMTKDGRLSKLIQHNKQKIRRSCSICTKPHVALGYCDLHYRHFRKKDQRV